ncbi:MAG: Dihydroxyacetone kinase-like protein, phosphatase domain / Dihydroxyacetone kinase-like protein, kinase domain [uncultured Rubrobacteraceae bacterium]|uniref:Dihydroxyacetone kinase-like protein, phosphatase domain / Dihydroxyacetone kinase-like protein, kinase domain n=1 Tax=uncultured Rubrobacteraceae bacterium TaxID=349277 RepID=A0A6J4QPR2_9ACTN|nr:MAG: Dihydroxyacetone kinase-like protein, phosphatase domain / Dihydroxyacetone kinase-like protein, kinase domain [uncultured Rubrobacteraceae bacterium]
MEGTAEKREGAVVNADLKTAVASAHAALAIHAPKINALNVYPVPDGDTGTNMLLTLRSILEKVSTTPGLEGEPAAKVVSRAALMGARGNSGVILSQIVRGACEALNEAHTLEAGEIAAALAGAEERAYATVSEPVEGTMLSVIKDAAGAARSCVERGEKDRVEVLRAAAGEAHASVKRSPELLDVLAQAGVVDAGGLGVAVILDGIVAAMSGEEPAPSDLLEDEKPEAGGERLRETVAHSAEEAWGYCTEFFVDGFSGEEKEFEARFHELGKSVLVVPDDDLVKVHLHTQDPGEALTYAGGFGRLSGVKVEDMEAQTRARVGGVSQPVDAKTVASIGVVVASRGVGNRELFESMGAVIVEGGQGANPSAEELVRAVEATGAADVILLPNNKNVVPTAERVGELVETRTHVVPTTSIVCGLAAMVGYDPEGEPDEVVEEMREILQGLRCAEVTRAVRDARVDGREVREGAYIGLLDGELLVAEGAIEDAALELVGRMLEEGADVVTLLRGAELGEADAERIAEAIRRMDADLLVEVKDGGQPLYPLQMVAE